jgi:hypothetical protein
METEIVEPEAIIPCTETPEAPTDTGYTYRQLTDEEVLAIKPTDTGMIAKLVRSVRRTVPQSEKFYERAAIKLTWFLRAGYPLVEPNLKELSTPTLISFYSDCTGTEMEMSDSAFRSDWSESAHTRRRIRIEKGYLADESGKIIVKAKKNTKRIFKLICAKCSETFPAIRHGVKKCTKCGGPPDPSKRYCALGPKCFRAEKGHPAECLTASPYCGKNCLGAFQAAVKRSREAGSQKAGSGQSDSPSESTLNAGF